jgi:hypothetical protein
MRDAKAGAWWERAPARYMSNNSAVYASRPQRTRFDAEWAALAASGSGERGLFCRSAAAAQAARFHGRKTDGIAFGTNPCSEIILRPQQFCNLSEVRLCAQRRAALRRCAQHPAYPIAMQLTPAPRSSAPLCPAPSAPHCHAALRRAVNW